MGLDVGRIVNQPFKKDSESMREYIAKFIYQYGMVLPIPSRNKRVFISSLTKNLSLVLYSTT
jgi:hypothetical protein